jgi:hypothetical protein
VTFLAFDERRGRVTVDSWSSRAAWIRRHDSQPGTPWSALVEVRRGVAIMVIGDNPTLRPWVELWSGDPGDADGLAVIFDEGALEGVARIPLCGCGDRGCGNVGIQLAADIAAEDFPRLVDLLRALPDVPHDPTGANLWRGEFHAGEPVT